MKSLTKEQRASQIFARLEKQNPNPKCELYFNTPFQLLTSVVLSAQTTDKQVNKVMQSLYDNQNLDAQTIVSWGADKLLQHIKSIGLAPTKSKNLYRLSTILVDRYQGEVPRTRSELEALPGVGRKTASVILGELYNEPTIAVDTHVFRVSKRLGLHKVNDPKKVEKILCKIIDKKYLPRAHHWLILMGRYTCKAQNPQCAICPISDLCPKIGVKTKKVLLPPRSKSALKQSSASL